MFWLYTTFEGVLSASVSRMPTRKSSEEVFGEIDESLRRAYQQVLKEDLPERFSELLERLRAARRPPPAPGDEE